MFLKNVVIEYSDQNEEIAKFFPRRAKAVKSYRSSLFSKKCLLVELEKPFVYGQINEFGNHTQQNTHLLLSPRYVGGRIWYLYFEAHIILVPEVPDLDGKEVEIDRSNHVAWGYVRRRI